MAKKPLHVTQVALRSLTSSVAAVWRRGWAEMTGTRARSQASLIRALKACVLKGSAVTAGKNERRSGEVYSPTPKPHALETFQECEPLLERIRQFLCDGQITKGAAFDLKACSDNHPGGFTDEPVYRESRPLVKSATG